jgi:hypothetical protein
VIVLLTLFGVSTLGVISSFIFFVDLVQVGSVNWLAQENNKRGRVGQEANKREGAFTLHPNSPPR